MKTSALIRPLLAGAAHAETSYERDRREQVEKAQDCLDGVKQAGEIDRMQREQEERGRIYKPQQRHLPGGNPGLSPSPATAHWR